MNMCERTDQWEKDALMGDKMIHIIQFVSERMS